MLLLKWNAKYTRTNVFVIIISYAFNRGQKAANATQDICTVYEDDILQINQMLNAKLYVKQMNSFKEAIQMKRPTLTIRCDYPT